MFPGATKLASHRCEDLEAVVWDHPARGGLHGEVVRWGWFQNSPICWTVATVRLDEQGAWNIQLAAAAVEGDVNGGLLLATLRGLVGALAKLAEAEVTVG